MAEGYLNWNWDAAFDYMQRALDAQPNLTVACLHRAWYHVLFGRMREAMADHVRVRELDPLNSFAATWFAELYRYERRYDEAAAEAMRALDFAPKSTLAHWMLGGVYADQGRHDEALAAIAKAGEVNRNWRWALGPAYVAAGRTAEARKLLAELNQQAPDPWTAYWRVELNAALGEYDEAFRWLDYEPHHTWVPWVRVIPRPGLAALRKDPRFPALLRRWKLPPL
jgi:tetratricopeptide (TPR) repeat protein